MAYSSGNHAQATAIAAKHVGVPATIVMPEDAPRSKMEATRAHGANIVTYNRFTESREAIAQSILKETGATLVPPFDHPMIMAGQGTAALELLDETGPFDALIAPVGGGGLLSGCATIAKAMQPAIRVFGAEPEGANDTFLSMQAGERIAVHPDTIADGLRAPKPGELTFPVIRATGGAGDSGKRGRNPRRREVPPAAAEDSGGAQRRGPVAAVLFRKLPPEIQRRRRHLRRQRGFRGARVVLRRAALHYRYA